MQDKVTFLLFVTKILSSTERVLTFYHLAPERPRDLDFEPYLKAMSRLCQEQQCSQDGIEDLRHLKQVFDEVRPPRNGGSSEQLRAGRESAARYEQWLAWTFPDAERPRPGLN